MPNIQGTDRITLQSTTQKAPYRFNFPVCSSVLANDGIIPYGDSLASCTVKIYDADGNDKTSEILDSSSVAGNVVKIELNYPPTSGPGKYKLTFEYITANGYEDEADGDRIIAVDL